MRYTLMNKDKPLLELDMEAGVIRSIGKIYKENEYLMPVFLLKNRTSYSWKDVYEWWRNRHIPASRNGIKELFWRLEGISLDELSEKSMGLSLSDQFWIRPDKDVEWNDINFFTNDFSEDIGRLLISGEWNGGSLVSPDNTSDGMIKKRWKIIDGKRCLIKGSSDNFIQAQPFREVFASKIAELLMKPFEKKFVVPYTLIKDENFVYSVCPNFITVDSEYVSFNQINAAYKKPNHISAYEFCRQFYKEFDYVLDVTLILDYIVLNEDRHFGNFGMIRDANTGNWISPAPIFDTGSCLFFNSPKIEYTKLEAKPFNKNFDKQIKHINVAKYYDSLILARDNWESIFNECFADCYEDKKRLESIKSVIKLQIDKLMKL